MVYYFKPYAIDGNYGAACNQYMQLLPSDEDWGCIIDGDTCFLTSDWGHQIQEIIDREPDTGLFTCITNRVGNLKQCYQEIISNDPNILYHIEIAEELSKEQRHTTNWLYNVISGHLMLVKKKTWKEIGGFKDGVLGVDNDFSRKILHNGHNIVLMEGLYLFHKYRIHKGIHDKSHLPKINK